ncbi:Cytochrome P450 monooxygenase [Lachnellula willkommii]|uniref:Cytochrome P450 monooxygenase n=1 Tax=Lachnellula willkommii TaxID=215461 RepID=A0A559MGK1_9HELO|nr:Cytochrome P450 monooxygenase [Lachnellula willkommii]
MALLYFNTSLATAITASLFAYFIYFVFVIVHRLYFSPLASFPGPKLAAATGWYEFYYQYWLNGQYIFQIEEMHKKYGPIVRVTPEELSIHDPEFYNELYVTESKRRTDHYDQFGQGIGFDDSHLFTKDHDLHRVRRKPLEPFFSRLGITRVQPMLAEVALHLETRLREFAGTNKVIRLDHAFSAYTGDIVGRMCLDTHDASHRFLSEQNFSDEWFDVIIMIIRSLPLFMAFPWIASILSYIPEEVLLWAYPRGRAFNKLRQKAKDNMREALASDSVKDEKVTSLFHHVVHSDMPESEKSEQRLIKEAQLLLAGGTFTSGRTIGVAAFYILSQPELRCRLEAELKDPMSTWPEEVPTWAELEKLVLLQAIIKESLRISYGIMHRLPRISPDVPLKYKQYTIPIGVPVGMSAYFMHSDPTVYKSPLEFIPDRWIGDVNTAMYRNYVPFAKGSRNCLGINLAMAEITLALAVLFRPNGPKLELIETDESDVKQAHDFAVSLPRLDTKGMRAVVR